MPGTCGVHRRRSGSPTRPAGCCRAGLAVTRWAARLLAVGGYRYRVPADNAGAVPQFSSSVTGPLR
jgi:hypothetical protein